MFQPQVAVSTVMLIGLALISPPLCIHPYFSGFDLKAVSLMAEASHPATGGGVGGRLFGAASNLEEAGLFDCNQLIGQERRQYCRQQQQQHLLPLLLLLLSEHQQQQQQQPADLAAAPPSWPRLWRDTRSRASPEAAAEALEGISTRSIAGMEQQFGPASKSQSEALSRLWMNSLGEREFASLKGGPSASSSKLAAEEAGLGAGGSRWQPMRGKRVAGPDGESR